MRGGLEKRDILSKRIRDGKRDQKKAKERIKTAPEAFQELTGFDGGGLENVHKMLNGEFEKAARRAKVVSDQINSEEERRATCSASGSRRSRRCATGS